ncbi:MAG TPA: hypothetical protein VM491_21170 [Burkholderiaceae bacterium]|jgi:hypothetical protein|nr:hypothetical protein [Burkholderiaceae bacterium]
MNLPLARLLLCLAALSLLAACPTVDRARTGAEAPRVDISTPQQAVESYWLLLDWYRTRATAAQRRPQQNPVPPQLPQLMAAVATGEALASFAERTATTDRLERRLETVAEQSESQAVVTARVKNLTTDPATVLPTPVELFDDAAGRLRYVLRKEADGWKVAEVWRTDEPDGPRRVR